LESFAWTGRPREKFNRVLQRFFVMPRCHNGIV
jgi:hypothetical protein